MYNSDKPYRDDGKQIRRSNSELNTSRKDRIDENKHLPKINEANHRLMIRTDRFRHSSYHLNRYIKSPDQCLDQVGYKQVGIYLTSLNAGVIVQFTVGLTA